jgi:hypothetical protein
MTGLNPRAVADMDKEIELEDLPPLDFDILTDVDLAGVMDGDILVYDLALEMWVPQAPNPGTVTSFIFTDANGIEGVVTLDSSTPTLVLELTDITPTSVLSSGPVEGSNLSGTNTGDQLVFSVIEVAGQSDVTADNGSDTLTIVAGANVTITTSGNSITIASSGGGGGGAGTVTSFSFVDADGIVSSVSNATTTPQLTLQLGNITPDSVASAGPVTGSNLSGTNTGNQTTSGTANEISVASGSGNPVISLPVTLTFTGKTITGGTFTGGAFNGTVGATTPSSGAFTTLSSSGNTTLGDAGTDVITLTGQVSASSSVGVAGDILASRGPNLPPEWVSGGIYSDVIIKTVSGTLTAAEANCLIILNFPANFVATDTLDLPPASTVPIGYGYVFSSKNLGDVEILPDGTDTILGLTTAYDFILSRNSNGCLISNGVNGWEIAYYTPSDALYLMDRKDRQFYGKAYYDLNNPSLVYLHGENSYQVRFQEALADSFFCMFQPTAGATTVTQIGDVLTAVGTATIKAIAATNAYTVLPGVSHLVTVAASNAIASYRSGVLRWQLFGPSAQAELLFSAKIGLPTGVIASGRFFCGLINSVAAPTDVEPSTQVNCIGVGWDSADTNIQVMHNDATGTCTKVNSGIPVPSANATNVYTIHIQMASSTCNVKIGDEAGNTFSAVTVTNIPVAILLAMRMYHSVGGVSSVTGLTLFNFTCETRTNLGMLD